MNDASTLPPYPDDSKFERDGTLKQGRKVDTPEEWHGDWRYPIFGEPDDGGSDRGSDGGPRGGPWG